MSQNENPTTVFDACSTHIAYETLSSRPKGRSMQDLYQEMREGLIELYLSNDDARGHFVDQSNQKRCWVHRQYRFHPFGLDWGQALESLQAVYADCPLPFFPDLYKTGGNPDGEIISPVIDAECRSGKFRRFYARAVEEEVVGIAMQCMGRGGDRAKAKAAYDLIIHDSFYDNNKSDSRFTRYVDIPSHSILGYVRNRAAGCQGFARTYQAVMNYLSLKTVSYSGVYRQSNGQTGSHTWNYVYLDDESRWILVDITVGLSGGDIGFDRHDVRAYGDDDGSRATLEYDRYKPDLRRVIGR